MDGFSRGSAKYDMWAVGQERRAGGEQPCLGNTMAESALDSTLGTKDLGPHNPARHGAKGGASGGRPAGKLLCGHMI